MTDDPNITFGTDGNPPQHVSEFRTRDHYPEETAEQWQDIRRGLELPVDDAGHPVDDLHDAYCILVPDRAFKSIKPEYTGLGKDEPPPVTSIRVGKPTVQPEEDHERFFHPLREPRPWVDPETGDLMFTQVTDGEERTVNYSERLRNDD